MAKKKITKMYKIAKLTDCCIGYARLIDSQSKSDSESESKSKSVTESESESETQTATTSQSISQTDEVSFIWA